MDKVGNIFTLELDGGSIFYTMNLNLVKKKNSILNAIFLKSKQKMANLISPNLEVLIYSRRKKRTIL